MLLARFHLTLSSYSLFKSDLKTRWTSINILYSLIKHHCKQKKWHGMKSVIVEFKNLGLNPSFCTIAHMNHVSGGGEYVQPGHPPMRIIGLFFIWEMLNIPAGSKQELQCCRVTGRRRNMHAHIHMRAHTRTCIPPACCFFFLPTAAPMTCNSSSSEAPERNASRRETSAFPNKHT